MRERKSEGEMHEMRAAAGQDQQGDRGQGAGPVQYSEREEVLGPAGASTGFR